MNDGPTGSAGAAPPRVRLLGPAQAVRHLPGIADVGGQAFTQPPWCEPQAMARTVAARVLADSHRPGFVLAVALDGEETCGFAYGHRCSTLAALARRPRGNDFTLKELAVLPRVRGHGLGAALHDAVLSAARGGAQWLATDPAATAALGLYRSRGWWTAALCAPHGRTRVIMCRTVT
ncbi:GNAT family N-acetyltransferase [Streptosporangium sandarakinum]